MNTARETITVLNALGGTFRRMAVDCVDTDPGRAELHAEAANKMYDAAQVVIALAKNSNTGLDAVIVEPDARPTLEQIRNFDHS